MSIRLSILFILCLPALFSCSEQEELTNSSGEPGDIPAGISQVAFRSNSGSLCVYIFRQEEDNVFRYDSSIDEGWSADGKLTARLRTGVYKFLFTSPLTDRLDLLPATMDKNVTIDQVRFAAKKDDKHSDAVLPTGDFYLPQPEVTNTEYIIDGRKEIKCKLERRVSLLEFALKRGFKEGGTYTPLPFKDKHNILEIIKGIQVKISGVATECNYQETSGESNVYYEYQPDPKTDVDAEGFATFEGPYVFPPATGKEVGLDITFLSADGAAYQPLQLTGILETNKKLQVTLWLNSADFSVAVTVDTLPISGSTEGDSGIWE